MTGLSYAEYLESVRAQEARDRDRFVGTDSHEDEPMYSAETGMEKSAWEIVAEDVEWVDGGNGYARAGFVSWEEAAESVRRLGAVIDAAVRNMTLQVRVVGNSYHMLIHGDGTVEPSGTLTASQWEQDADKVARIFGVPGHMLGIGEPPKQPAPKKPRTRHTYPRPHREWWNRR